MINTIKTIGIVGGGQLGRMMIPSIKAMGLQVVVLDPSKDCPCASQADKLIVAGFGDEAGFLALAKVSDVITYEFEHIDTTLLAMLEDKGHKVYPSVQSLKVIQDKYTQKKALKADGIAVPDLLAIKDLNGLKEYWAKTQKPFMLKSRRGGYDGKGNFVVKCESGIEEGFKMLSRGNDNDLMVEPMVDFEKEVSVIATRGIDGSIEVYPICENVHKDSILDTTTVPAHISDSIAKKAMDVAKNVMECFKGVGTFCTELFISEKTGEVLVNEVAPRVHNSGHFSIEACRTSQFENHIRAIIGLKPNKGTMVVPFSIMKNLIGSKDGVPSLKGIECVANLGDTNVHIYGKLDSKKGRKMGHVTLTGTEQEVKEKLAKVKIEL